MACGRSVLRAESPDGRIPATAAFVIGFGLLTLPYRAAVGRRSQPFFPCMRGQSNQKYFQWGCAVL